MPTKKLRVTDSLVDSLMEDWLERDGETFVHIRKTGRLGWEKELEGGESYSAYILESPTQEDLIKRAYSLAKDMIVVMDPPFKVIIRISNSGTGGTDGRFVYVSTSVFDDPELSVGEKLDTFLGITIHEGCHLLYTDLSWLKRITIPIVLDIWNVIEDERIERLCGDLKPGLANFLEKSKYYVFDQYYLDVVVPAEKAREEEEKKRLEEALEDVPPIDELEDKIEAEFAERKKLSTLMRFINCFMKIIRYPKYLKEEEVVEFAKYLVEVKKVVLPYPTTTEESVKAAYKVFDIVKELYIDKEREEDEDKPEEEKRSDEELEAEAMRKLSADSRDAADKLKKVSSSMPSESAPSGDGRLSDDEMAEAVKAKGGLLGELCEGSVELGGGRDTYFTWAKDREDIYRMCAAKVRKYVPAMSKIMKGHCREYKLIHRSMRSGVLDTGKLVEAVQGVPTVYLREGEVKADRIAVCVLIDESGSMSGERIVAARDTAVLINEAIGDMPNVELYIYGHSGDMRDYRSTEMMIYREKGYHPRYSLGSVSAKCENRDGIAIIETAKRVRSQTKNPVLMFVLSDGAPCAGGYGGSTAMEHVRKCVGEAERMGFSIIQVCINHSYDPAKMFKNYVILEDMSTLAFELSKKIKKAAMTLAKVHIT